MWIKAIITDIDIICIQSEVFGGACTSVKFAFGSCQKRIASVQPWPQSLHVTQVRFQSAPSARSVRLSFSSWKVMIE